MFFSAFFGQERRGGRRRRRRRVPSLVRSRTQILEEKNLEKNFFLQDGKNFSVAIELLPKNEESGLSPNFLPKDQRQKISEAAAAAGVAVVLAAVAAVFELVLPCFVREEWNRTKPKQNGFQKVDRL